MIKEKPTKDLLTEEELLFLRHLAIGTPIRTVGKKFDLSEYQAYQIFKIIKTKLKAKNKPHAVYNALQLKILP